MVQVCRARAGVATAVLVGVLALAGCGLSPAATAGPPTATPTTAQRITLLVEHALGRQATAVTADYSNIDEAATVTVNVAWLNDVSAAQEQVKVVCFRAQAALWTSGVLLRKVTVLVQGPLIDLYADQTTGPYGSAVLTAPHAAHFAWASLSADRAWDAYDNVFLRLAFNDAG